MAAALMKVAQEIMRHASITTTMDTYRLVINRDKRKTAGRAAMAMLRNNQ
jgi:integrase